MSNGVCNIQRFDEFKSVVSSMVKGGIKEPLWNVDAHPICDRVFLGSYNHGAIKKEFLKNLGITHIVSIGEQSRMPKKFPDFVYKIIEMDDSPQERIYKHFRETSEFIEKSLKESEKNKVFIHCWAGVSRSASLVAAYLIDKYGLSFLEALETVRKSRFWINPNHGFLKQLEEWDMELHPSSYKDKKLSRNVLDDKVYKKYFRIKNDLNAIYEHKLISKEKAEKMVKIFEEIFGPDHPHTIDLQLELNMRSYG